MEEHIYINGNLILEDDCVFRAKTILMGQNFDPKHATYDGDFRVNKQTPSSYLTSYFFSGKEVVAFALDSRMSFLCSDPSYVVERFHFESTQIMDLFKNEHIPRTHKYILYIQTFTSLISSLEVCLSDLLLCDVFSSQTKFETFKSIPMITKKLKEKGEKDIDIIIKNIIDRQLYHQFHKVKKLFEDQMNIVFPDISYFVNATKKRHILAHRFGNSQNTFKESISSTDVEELYTKSVELVDQLCASLNIPRNQKHAESIKNESYF